MVYVSIQLVIRGLQLIRPKNYEQIIPKYKQCSPLSPLATAVTLSSHCPVNVLPLLLSLSMLLSTQHDVTIVNSLLRVMYIIPLIKITPEAFDTVRHCESMQMRKAGHPF